MITNLNSWSFEPSSNKSVGNLSGSFISIPSHDHSAQSTADHPSAPVAFTVAPSVRSVHPRFNGPVSFVFIRGSFSRHQPDNLTNLTVLTLHNPLISRVCTPFHINQKNSHPATKSLRFLRSLL